MSRFYRGQLWDDMPWLLCEESGRTSILDGQLLLIPGSVTLSSDVIDYWWRYANGPTHCWLYAGTCSHCGRKFVEYTEADPDIWQETNTDGTARLQKPFTVCNHCTAKRKADSSRVTSKRYREARQLQPMAKHCKQCGELFYPKRSTAQFCSSLCRQHHHRGHVKW